VNAPVPFGCRLAVAGLVLLAPTTPLQAQAARITPALMTQHIGVLADDSMGGRATPSRELELAARYVEAVLRRAGLSPAGDEGGFVQRYPVNGRGGASGTAPNIIAVLPGQDRRLAGQYVLVVAHLDHTGIGRPVDGDSIYNGADDNASGASGVMALAEAFAGTTPRPKRSILFLVVSGEERGLLGSRWYVEHPTVAIDSIAALVNLDMIGRNRPDSVYLNGWGKGEVSDLVRRLAAEHTELGLSVGPDEEDRPVTPADSDHWPFQQRGVPYIFFYTGAHPDYHRVGDEPRRVDADKAARIARLTYYTLLDLANSPSRPAWDPAARLRNVPDHR
jgi:Zn-dependent M28 family amino/carboxypeptidase